MCGLSTMLSMKQIGLVLIPVFVSAGQSGQQSAFNEVYRGADGEIFSRKPNAFLAEMICGRTPGTALDVGMGQGRNAIFLASKVGR
jgi:hypothetical protein